MNLAPNIQKNIGSDLGLIGIGLGAGVKGYEMLHSGITGDIKKSQSPGAEDYKLLDKDRNTAKVIGGIGMLQSIGFGLADFKQIESNALNVMKGRAMTEDKYKDYNKLLQDSKKIRGMNIFKVIDGNNIFEAFTDSLTQNDIIPKAEYLLSLKEKYGKDDYDKFVSIISGLKNSDLYISSKDQFAMDAVSSKDNNMKDMAVAMSYKKPETSVYLLYKIRESMQNKPTEFYNLMRIGMMSGAINGDIALKYLLYLKDNMKDSRIDQNLLSEIVKQSGITFKEDK
jgi:hypothetical protein